MLTSANSYFEVINKPQVSSIRCVVLDYDGTLTTLRKGWDVILTEYANSKINPYNRPCEGLDKVILHLTDHAGGTTPKQLMARLVKIMRQKQLVPPDEIQSIEYYAKEYADHFQKMINKRVESFSSASESYVIESVRPMLNFISEKETINYIVTGSCEMAVTDELQKLEMFDYFSGVYGATIEMEGNLKMNAIREIMYKHSIKPCEILIIGDGSTEIRAANELELPAIGIASDEHDGGLCEKKRKLLKGLGAHAIIADYSGFQNVWNWLHESEN